jgi:hypothetical protein
VGCERRADEGSDAAALCATMCETMIIDKLV